MVKALGNVNFKFVPWPVKTNNVNPVGERNNLDIKIATTFFGLNTLFQLIKATTPFSGATKQKLVLEFPIALRYLAHWSFSFLFLWTLHS